MSSIAGEGRGLYLVLEGGDATGKSHQASLLVDWLRAQGRVVQHLREPGSTPTGEALRQLLLDPATGDLSPLSEALLFSAARTEMLRTEVQPARDRGEVVLVERCYLSTLVYQGYVEDSSEQTMGANLDLLRAVTAAAHGEVWPDRIFLLDVDETTRAARQMKAGKSDRIEARGEAFHGRVQRGYLELGAGEPSVAVVDARQPLLEVQDELRTQITAMLATAEAS